MALELKQVPLFSGLNQRQLRRLARLFKERRVPDGRPVVKQGEMSGVSFFVIAAGEASVLVDGKEVAKLGPGDYFGELALISQQPRTATVKAVGTLTCRAISFWDFRSFAKDNPEVTWKLLQHLVELLGEERSRNAGAPPRRS